MTYDANGVNPFAAFVARYGPAAGELGPVLMAREVFGVETLDAWQEVALRAYGRGVRRISISSCHGPGKTFVAAMCIWHMLLTKFPQKTVATAPTRAQIFDALFAEVMSWSHRLKPAVRDLFEFKSDRIEHRGGKDDSFFSARTARAEKPEALQGVHSAHVLLIADEASGVPEAIYEAAVGSMSGANATTLLLSNPTRSSGFFYDTHHKLADMWFRINVGYWPDADDERKPARAYHTKRVVQDFADDVAARYGEDSNAYRVRVLGLFPLADDEFRGSWWTWRWLATSRSTRIGSGSGVWTARGSATTRRCSTSGSARRSSCWASGRNWIRWRWPGASRRSGTTTSRSGRGRY
jgi:hypothetical protein